VLAGVLAAEPFRGGRCRGDDVVDPSVDPAGPVLAAAAEASLLVTRPCYLSLRRAVAVPLQPTGVVLVVEPGRARDRQDVDEVLGAPVVAEVLVDPAVAGPSTPGCSSPGCPARSSGLWVGPHDGAGAGRAREPGPRSGAAPPRAVRAGRPGRGRPPGGVAGAARLAAARRPAVQAVTEAVLARALGLGPLEPLLADPGSPT
jgi:hypothetical protein